MDKIQLVTDKIAVGADNKSFYARCDGDGNAIAALPRPTSATPTNVDASATVVELITVTEATKKVAIYNDSTALLKIGYTSDTSATKKTWAVTAKQGITLDVSELPVGKLYGIWESADGVASVTEFN